LDLLEEMEEWQQGIGQPEGRRLVAQSAQQEQTRQALQQIFLPLAAAARAVDRVSQETQGREEMLDCTAAAAVAAGLGLMALETLAQGGTAQTELWL
jgi:hypothetical protein